MGTEIKELYSALQRFIERRQKMYVPVEEDDDDIIIANAFDELDRLRKENKHPMITYSYRRADMEKWEDHLQLVSVQILSENIDAALSQAIANMTHLKKILSPRGLKCVNTGLAMKNLEDSLDSANRSNATIWNWGVKMDE